jgi:hypothetical protein
MSTLVWGVKASLLGYVRGMPDGEVLLDGVTEEPEGFVFPEDEGGDDGGLGFRGSVTLVGHGGMMHVALADPALTPDGDGWMLSITDPDDATLRLSFARVAALTDEGGVLRGSGTVLTPDGADLFFGPYTAGTPLDDPLIRP